MDTIKIDKKNTKIIAHRGLSGIEKENTCSAFVAAGNRSYFGIETDVHKTLDGKYVIFHDDTTGRVATDDLAVEKSTYDTLKKLVLTDTDGKKSRTDLVIPDLVDYIRICKKYGKTAVLELKNRFEKEEVFEIVSIIEKENYLDNVIFISFCLENLVNLKSKYPDQKAEFLEDDFHDSVIYTLKKYGLGIDIRYTELNKERIDLFHKNGIEVNCWTCNDPEAGEKLAEYGIDYITTNILE
jgi:glycerophosphoryl diester phosphodiesterase